MAFLQRLLGALQDVLQPSAVTQEPVRSPTVGTGSSNEAHIEIGGVPNLFRDEGEHIVHFVAAFEPRPTATRFGQKLLPDPVPYWCVAGEYPGAKLAGVIAAAIRAHATPVPSVAMAGENNASPSSRKSSSEVRNALPATVSAPARRASNGTAHRGKITFWGEAEFPDRKRVGRTYQSFALKLETATGTETLQGEGLKDAIAESGCQLGDSVEVRRLEKVKVQAFHRRSGKPKLDDDGQPILWDKWLWSITRSH
ncbi:hypothetical protein [Cupriavidus pinatubonensis]|uniref:HIRAN domain-containing protein n=1 Tax=Cupriavidus pinatubonensis TaxID=248026 RepID=A0ABM8WEE2_9BURK|nr:hypothetical protein [Cupriavidus pinatubonensis]CAG9165690.1 hypothetical protein LMG23994_00783 [Cupriavidus pinatubonensis]